MHFYSKTENGVEPRHYVPMSKDPSQLRPSRLSDAKKAAKDGEIWVPSVTTILNVLAKPALINWKIDQHLIGGLNYAKSLTDPDLFNLEMEMWLGEVKRLTELEMDKAPSAGTDFHKCMELYLTAAQLDMTDDMRKLCESAQNCIADKVSNGGSDKWNVEVNFVADGYGGQIDLVTDGWIIDFKTKQEAAKFKPGKMAYDDHYTQLGAYREGIGQPTARCANLFVCLGDGQMDFHEHKEEDLQKGWQIFQHSLAIFNLQKGF